MDFGFTTLLLLDFFHDFMTAKIFMRISSRFVCLHPSSEGHMKVFYMSYWGTLVNGHKRTKTDEMNKKCFVNLKV